MKQLDSNEAVERAKDAYSGLADEVSFYQACAATKPWVEVTHGRPVCGPPCVTIIITEMVI